MEHNTPTLRNGDGSPLLFYGTARRQHKSPPDVVTALRLGYRAIDTAGSRRFHHEADDGRAVSEFLTSDGAPATRNDIFVQSKYAMPVDHDDGQRPYELADDTTARVFKSVLRSTSDLGTDVIDAYFVHTPPRSFDETLEVWGALERIVSAGGIRYLGIANVGISRLRQLHAEARVKPTFVQNWFRKAAEYDREVMAFCRDHGITYQVFGVFDEANNPLLECGPVLRRSVSKSLSRHQALLQMLLGGASMRRLQLCVLDGATSPDHMRDNLAAAEGPFDLSESDLEEFWRLIGWQ